MKTCSKCGETKTLDSFNKNRQIADGRRPECRECQKKSYSKNRAHRIEQAKVWALNNPKKTKAYKKKWEQEHPDKVKERNERRKHEYREQHRENCRRWYAANTEKISLCIRLWKRKNPEKVKCMDMRRRARMRGATSERVDFSALLEKYGMVCHICGEYIAERSDLHFDHVIPLAKGGSHTKENIRPSHKVCNFRKNAKIVPHLIEAAGLELPEY